MRLTLNLACCCCIQAYFTAAVAQSTPLPFLRCPAPPSDGHCLSAAVSVPHTGVHHGPPSPDAQSGDISRSTCVMYSHSHLGLGQSGQWADPIRRLTSPHVP